MRRKNNEWQIVIEDLNTEVITLEELALIQNYMADELRELFMNQDSKKKPGNQPGSLNQD
jgi:hypothetical protein